MDAIAWQFAENLVITRKRAHVSQEELGFRANLHGRRSGNWSVAIGSPASTPS